MIQKSKKILIIGHVWPQPNATAAGEHMLHLIHFFKNFGYQLFFVSAAQQPDNYKIFSELSIDTAVVAINDATFDRLLLEYEPNIVLFDRFMVEEQFSWRVKKICPNAIRILDTEDLHFLRKQRQKQLNTTGDILLTDDAKRELASMYRCDLNLMISLKEMEFLKTTYNFPDQLLHYIPLLSDFIEEDTFNSFENRRDLVFVGNFLHNPNWHAVQVLKREIWPLLSKQLPDVKLHIYGAYATEKNYQLHNEKQGFLVHGYVKDIETVLQKSRLLIAPLYFGAGQKGKLLKAMQCGTPTITTTIGAEAMQFDKLWPGVIVDSVKDFVAQTVLLYKSVDQWNTAQKSIPDLVNTHYLFEKHYQVFKEKLEELTNGIIAHRNSNIIGQILWHQSMRSTEFMSRWIIEKNKH